MPRDDVYAIELYSIAARKQSPEALRKLAVCHMKASVHASDKRDCTYTAVRIMRPPAVRCCSHQVESRGSLQIEDLPQAGMRLRHSLESIHGNLFKSLHIGRFSCRSVTACIYRCTMIFSGCLFDREVILQTTRRLYQCLFAK